MNDQVEKADATTLMGMLAEYLESAEQVVIKYAPDVWDATLAIIRLQSAMWLLLWIVAASAFGYAFYRAILQFKANGRTNVYSDQKEWPIPVSMVSAMGLTACFGFAVAGGVRVLLGLFSPELAILYSLGSKVGLF